MLHNIFDAHAHYDDRWFDEDRSALLASLKGSSGFDIVLLDPPYETGLASAAIRSLDEYGLLNEGAILLCEHSRQNPPEIPNAHFTAREARKYGDCYLTYIVYSAKEGQTI